MRESLAESSYFDSVRVAKFIPVSRGTGKKVSTWACARSRYERRHRGEKEGLLKRLEEHYRVSSLRVSIHPFTGPQPGFKHACISLKPSLSFGLEAVGFVSKNSVRGERTSRG